MTNTSLRRCHNIKMFITDFCVVVFVMASLASANDNLSVAYEWNELDFAYRNTQDRAEAIASGEFVPANVIPVGLEVFKHRLFLTLPRLKNGVPASLAYINLNGKSYM